LRGVYGFDKENGRDWPGPALGKMGRGKKIRTDFYVGGACGVEGIGGAAE